MKKHPTFWQTKQGNSVLYGVSLFLPYILFTAALIFLSVFAYRSVINNSLYYQLAISDTEQEEIPEQDEDSIAQDVIEDATEFPVIHYLSQWATLNVEGWEKNTDMPVYFGNEETILKKGVATPSFTTFCGEGGKIVFSAHVTRHFYELEETEIGTKVTVDTIYGRYVYEVKEKVIFNQEDGAEYLMPDDSEEVLLMYTCYPLKNNYRARTQRCALICKKVSGKDW